MTISFSRRICSMESDI